MGFGSAVCRETQGSSSEHTAGLPRRRGAQESVPPPPLTGHVRRGSRWARWTWLFLVCVSALGELGGGRSREERRAPPPDLRLEVLVDLGHVLHHALPVGPVCVQHLTELLRERAEVTGRHEAFPRSRQVQATPSRC